MNIPSPEHLARTYYELGQLGARAVGAKKQWPYHPKTREALLCLAADFARFDPRLLEILVQYSLKAWQLWMPQELRRLMGSMSTPQVWGVIASFAQTEQSNSSETRHFWNYLIRDLQPVEPQFFYFDLHLPGTSLAEQAVKETLYEFKQWGFFGRDRITVDPATRRRAGSWDQSSRLNILKRLFAKNKQLQISDYLEAIEQTISRQQAILDLKKSGAKLKGTGRGAYWTP